MVVSVVLVVSLVAFLFTNKGEGAHHPHKNFGDEYTYDVKDMERGPLAWGGECTSGLHQSPIDIRYKDHGVSWGYTKVWFSSQYQQSQKGFFFTNRGHTFQVQLNGNIREPTSSLGLSGAGLHHRYTFSQMHFHWGDRDEVGSEHTLQGQRYPMEIHLVHYKTKYSNLSHALQENSEDHDAVLVLGILCELGLENPSLHPIVDAARLKVVQNPGNKLMFSYQSLNLHKLFPKHLDFVRYMGSLTTPPCTEKVAWTVFLCPISISSEQLEVFRRLHDADEEEYYNYRPLQKRNGRTLKYFKVPDSSETDGSETGSSPGAGGNGGGTQAISLIKTTITNTLQEVNSLFSNIINVLSDAQLCEPEEQYMLELLRSKNITKLSQLQEFKKIGEGITKVKEAKKTKPIK